MSLLADTHVPLPGLKRRLARACTAGMLSLNCGEPASALEWQVNGEAKVAEEYSTNIFLRTPAPRDGAWAQGFDTSGRIGASELNWHSTLTGRFNDRWYLPDSNLDYHNQLFDWTSAYTLERARFELDAQYNMDTTLTQAADLTSNIGYVFSRIPKTTRVLAPAWHYALTEKTGLGVHYSYQDTEYDQKQNFNRFPDTRSHTASADLTYAWNERLKLIGNASYMDYALISAAQTLTFPGPYFDTLLQVPGTTNSIRIASAMLGLDYALSESTHVSLSGGAQYNQAEVAAQTVSTILRRPNGDQLLVSERTTPTLTSDSLGEVYSAKLDQHLESADVGLDFSRSTSPNINGRLITYDTYSLRGNYRFSPLLTGSANFSYTEQTFPGVSGQTNQSRQVISFQGALRYQWSLNWIVSGSYQYTQIDYPEISSAPNNHALALNLQYLFDQRF